MERSRIYDLLTLLARNTQPAPNWTAGFEAARFLMRRIIAVEPIARARRNVAHHYDIDGAIYDPRELLSFAGSLLRQAGITNLLAN